MDVYGCVFFRRVGRPHRCSEADPACASVPALWVDRRARPGFGGDARGSPLSEAVSKSRFPRPVRSSSGMPIAGVEFVGDDGDVDARSDVPPHTARAAAVPIAPQDSAAAMDAWPRSLTDPGARRMSAGSRLKPPSDRETMTVMYACCTRRSHRSCRASELRETRKASSREERGQRRGRNAS